MTCECPPRLKHRVTIERPQGTPGQDGHVALADDANWTPVGVCWGAFKTRGGTEGRKFNQVQGEITHIIEMRSSPLTRSIRPTWRLRFQGRKFNITAAYDVDENRKMVQVHATEAV